MKIVSLYPPPIFWKYTAHLLRRTLKINAQRIKDTPALYFQLTPCICTVYFQKVFFAIYGASASLHCQTIASLLTALYSFSKISL